jgi:hypothetical protein
MTANRALDDVMNPTTDLPDGWMWVKLNQITEQIYRYPTFYGMKRSAKGVPVIRGEHISANGAISHDWNNYWFVSEDISRKYPRTIVKPQDLIMSVRGTVGKIGLIDVNTPSHLQWYKFQRLHSVWIQINPAKIYRTQSPGFYV